MMTTAPNSFRRMPVIMLFLLIGLMRSDSFAGTGQSQDSILAILQPADAIPQDATLLKELTLTNDNYGQDCAYYELLLKAKNIAFILNSNILKIRSRSAHSQTQRCDGLDVAFYQSAYPRKAEQSFTWNAARPLTWDDFTGPVRAGTADRTAAETSCGIAIETNLVRSGDKARVYAFNTFDRQTSWVREGKQLPGVLEHEQGHWNICELYKRRMQVRFDKAAITGATLSRKVHEIYDAVSSEYLQRQELYEQETQHGTIGEAQQRWTKMITDELAQDMTGRL